MLSQQETEISIKLSSMEKSLSGFIWAADKETITIIVFIILLLLELLLIQVWHSATSKTLQTSKILNTYSTNLSPVNVSYNLRPLSKHLLYKFKYTMISLAKGLQFLRITRRCKM